MGKGSQDDITVGQLPGGALTWSHSPSRKLIIRTYLTAKEAGSVLCFCAWGKRREGVLVHTCSLYPPARSAHGCDATSEGLTVWEGSREVQRGQGLLIVSSGDIFWSNHPAIFASMALGSCWTVGSLKSSLSFVFSGRVKNRPLSSHSVQGSAIPKTFQLFPYLWVGLDLDGKEQKKK